MLSALAELSTPPPKPQPVTLGQAVRNPQLLGADIPWWPGQLEMLDSLDGPEQLHIWAIGRQAGKTTMGAAAAIHNALFRPDLDEILPKSRIRYVLIAGVNRDGAYEVLKVVRGLLAQIPDLPVKTMKTLAGSINFELHTGRRVCIEAIAAWSPSARGKTVSLVVLDEFAHLGQTEGPGADKNLYGALTPALLRFGTQAKRLLISTPSGRSGKFYELFEQISDGQLASAKAWQAASWDLVPNMEQDWIDGQRAELGEALFSQEFEASFIEGGGAFFADLSSVDWASQPAEPHEASAWMVALDPAFHADGFGYAVLGLAHNNATLLVGPVGAIKPEGKARSFDARRGREDNTLAQIWELIAPYKPHRLITDQHQAAPIESYFGQRGILVEPVNVTGPIQTSAFVQLRARLKDGSLHCPRDGLLFDELRRVRAKDGTAGVHLPRYGDSHCDAAMALALGVWAHENGGGPMMLTKPKAAAPLNLNQRYSQSEFG